MNDNERMGFACSAARKEAEKRYKYGQTSFNFQFKVLARLSKKGYLEIRNDWRHR